MVDPAFLRQFPAPDVSLCLHDLPSTCGGPGIHTDCEYNRAGTNYWLRAGVPDKPYEHVTCAPLHINDFIDDTVRQSVAKQQVYSPSLHKLFKATSAGGFSPTQKLKKANEHGAINERACHLL